MKNSILNLISLVVFATVCSSCAMKSAGEVDRSNQTLSAAAVIASNATPKEKSEKLAVIADTLFSSGAFSQTLDVTDAALTIDPTNVRAGLISALAKPLATLKGILLRASPLLLDKQYNLYQTPVSFQDSYLGALGVLIDRSGTYYSNAAAANSVNGFAAILSDSNVYNSEEFNSYNSTATKGISGILARVESKEAKSPGYAFKNEGEFQEVLDDAFENFDQLRQFARDHKDSDITVTATALLIPDLVERYASACVVNDSATLVYELNCPPDEMRTHIRLNRADFELIADIAAYYEFAFAVFGGYDVPGASLLATGNSSEWVMENLVALPGFGKLRQQNNFKKLKVLGLDLIGGFNWALANQATLCKSQQDDGDLRPGFVFNHGFCVGRNFGSIISILSNAISGQTVKLNVGGPRIVDFKPTTFLDAPIADLAALKPEFNRVGAVTSVIDPTLGGVFPNRDANYVLKTSAGEAAP